jgi:RecJ-like exonuclease
VTDRLQCPDCKGTGRQVIGPLVLVCVFCQGTGYVGDDNEPAEDSPAPELGDSRGWIWNSPAVRGLPVCPMCLGAGKVVNLSDANGENRGMLIELPCPACTAE